MSVNLVVNGNTYAYPEQSDTNWGSSATDWAQAVTVGMLQKAGGLFQLLAEVDLGTTYGVKSVYFKSRTANPAAAGQLRLAKTDTVSWRNNANDGDLALTLNGSDQLTFNGTALQPAGNYITSLTGDVVASGPGAAASVIQSGVITNAMINASAAIAFSKLASLTASRALESSAGGVIQVSAVTSTELGYVSGVTSAIQTQLNGKQASGNYMTALTGDVVAAGPGSSAAAIQAGVITNTMISASAAIAFSKLAALTSGNILVGSAGNVATSVAMSGDISLSNAGVTAYAGTVPLNKGGTGQTTKAPAFDALSPMTTSGDIIYGGASGTGTRLAKGTDGQVLTLASGLPSWAAAGSSGANTHLSNLTDTVAINKSLLFDTTDVYDVGADGTRVNKIFANTIQYNSAIRYNLLDNRINDSSGNASIYPESFQLRTGSHGAPVTKLDWSGTTDLILGNSAGVVKTVTNLVPSAADTISLGTSSLRYNNVETNVTNIYDGSSAVRGKFGPAVTTPSGASAVSIRSVTASGNMAIWAANDAVSNSTKAASLFLEGGNKTAGTGDGGDVGIWTGTSAGGGRGTLYIKEKTFAGASAGYVLTLVSTSTGEVGFAAGGGGGANTTLSNLGTTALNASLIPATDNTYALGAVSKGFQNLFLQGRIRDSSNFSVMSAGGRILYDTAGTQMMIFSTAGSIDMRSNVLSNVGDPITTQDAMTLGYFQLNGATTVLDNLGSTAVNADIKPATDNNNNLGSASKRWAAGFFYSKVCTDAIFDKDNTTAIIDIPNQEILNISSIRRFSFGSRSAVFNGSNRTFPIGGTNFQDKTQVGNTAATETDAFDHNITSNTLDANGQSIEVEAAGTFANTISVDKRIKVKFGAATLFDSGNIAASAGGSWNVKGRIIRSGSSAQKSIFTITTNVSGLLATAQYNTSSEDLTTAVSLKLTLNGTNANDTVGEFYVDKWVNDN